MFATEKARKSQRGTRDIAKEKGTNRKKDRGCIGCNYSRCSYRR